MNIKLDYFFQNPNIYSAIVIIAFIIGSVAIVFLQNRSSKKIRAENKERGNEIVNALNLLSQKLQQMIDKERNNLNQQAAERVVASVFRESENTIKTEVLRVFYHNNRNKQKRQAVIKKSTEGAVNAVFDGCINSLKKLSYKEKSLSECVIFFKKEQFKEGLFAHIFDKTENDKQDMTDTFLYIETFFTDIISKSKSLISNL